MTLEEVRTVLEHSFGVRYAEEWRTRRRLDERRVKQGHISQVV